MPPSLHGLVLGAGGGVGGGVGGARVRRPSGVANDAWSWAAVAAGLVAIGGALVVGVGAILPWLQTTVHRVTEFGALAGWWIVAMWAVVAAGAPPASRDLGPSGLPPTHGSRSDGQADQGVHDPPPVPVGRQGWMDSGPAAT
jgi:hypothetical protein